MPTWYPGKPPWLLQGAEFMINPLGTSFNRRIGRRVNGALTQGWLYQGQLAIAAEVDSLGNVTKTFEYATGVNVPDAMRVGGTRYRLVTDHLGSVRLVVDWTTGEVAQRIDYDEYGRVVANTNPGFQPFGYAGGLLDDATGLTRFGMRDYDAESGRWTTPDPVRFHGGDPNLYVYVMGDPIQFIDPLGAAPCRALTAAGEIIVDESWANQAVRFINTIANQGWHGKVNASFRTRADQDRAWRLYKAGKGNTAAEPGTSEHEGAFALDVDYCSRPKSEQDVVWAAAEQYGLIQTAPGEAWHFSPHPSRHVLHDAIRRAEELVPRRSLLGLLAECHL